MTRPPPSPSPPAPPAGRSAADIRADYRNSFNELNRRLAGTDLNRHVRFFNFGYVTVGDEQPVGPPLSRAFPNPDSAQLLFQLTDGVPLENAKVVELGCGRGGNLALLRDLFGIGYGFGVDLVYPSLAFASTAYDLVGGFVQGDAESVPIRRGVADAVLNIESAGCYPHIEHFFSESARVLKVGGWFLYADLIHRDILPAYRNALNRLGFAIETDRDITPNVLASRERRADRERLALGVPGARALSEWVGQSGSVLHGALADGEWAYQLLRLKRTADEVHDVAVSSLFTEAEQAAISTNASFWADVLHLDPAEP